MRIINIQRPCPSFSFLLLAWSISAITSFILNHMLIIDYCSNNQEVIDALLFKSTITHSLIWLIVSLIIIVIGLSFRDLYFQLRELSIHDSLTGLYNRHYMTINYKKLYLSCLRQNSIMSILLIDIDDFKAYNDTNGHIAGDECLIKVANILKKVCKRESDFLCRYGDEEFIVMLPFTDREGAELLANNILSATNEANIKHPKSSVADHVTLSIGIVANGNCVMSNEAAIHAADLALYAAKKSGKNNYVVYS
jgi:diguanylate cyclase (GGDEF)-like protein